MKYTAPLLALLLLGAGCSATTEPQQTPENNVPLGAQELSMLAEDVLTPDVELFGTLDDVTGGEATGTASLAWTEQSETLVINANFQNLPELEEDFFYEGWIVRKLPLSVISTGALVEEGGTDWSNQFFSTEDLSGHGSYILTLEPDDGDPAPAEHVLEGKLTSVRP